MAGSRTRIRRRQSPIDGATVCAGHQELRDIVITTNTNVEHILKALEKGSDKMERLDTRVDTLEKIEENRKGAVKKVKSIADSRVTVASLLIAAASVGVAIVAVLWPSKGTP